MKKYLLAPAFLALLLGGPSPADEGMWLFTKPPRETLKKKYDFAPDDRWLEHVRKSSVRFNSGGSGSFVSADGLVMTNHHVGADALAKLSTKEKDYLKEGFHARSREKEPKCPGTELNVLMSIDDVTDEVNAAVKPGMTDAEAAAARRAVMAKIEKESLDKTKLRSDVVTLYQGGQYHLYRYKKYTDVRLVFAPEKGIAFFGGDPDNFEYPRYNLDVCFFRVYEDDKPAKIEHYLKWSPHGAKENELVFVSGHPGRTNRMNTMAELEYLRDLGYPFLLERLNRWEVMLSVFANQSAENRRQAEDFLFSVANSRKARTGGLAGLLDPDLMESKRKQEKKLREFVTKDEKQKDTLKAWDRIQNVQKVRTEIIKEHSVLEQGAGFNTQLFDIARTLVRAADEREKPNAERLREFRELNLESLKLQLFSEEEIYPEYEMEKLADGLTFFCKIMGYEHPLTQKVLAGKSPQARAAELVRGSKLKDVAERKRLYEGGKAAVDRSDDAMIKLARMVDEDSRRLRKRMEVDVEEAKTQAYAQLAKAKYAMEGDSVYPDATFTLRLAFGTVKGFEEGGKQVPHETTFKGLYERAREHNNTPPFDLPERWAAKKDRLDLSVPFNFVCTADIIGGNSGSPVINRDAEVVGIIFDGNIHSLVLDFVYADKQARAVSVHSRGIIEALKKVYDATELVEEIVGKK